MDVTAEGLARFFEVMTPLLDERQRRVLLEAAAEMLGRGGHARVTEASGASRSTVIAGIMEVKSGVVASDRVRAVGAGPTRLADTQLGLLEALDELVNPETHGASATTTDAPFSANRRQIAKPIPPAPPVTIAVRPSKVRCALMANSIPAFLGRPSKSARARTMLARC